MSCTRSLTPFSSGPNERRPLRVKGTLATRFAVLCGISLAMGACGGKAPSGSTAVSSPEPAREAMRSSGKIDTPALLTKEEVSAIIGSPVTSLESNSKSHVTYKTANPMLEASLEAERGRSTADAQQTMAGARTATNMLGGKPEAVTGLGDEAFFGAMSFLYVRSGDVVLTVTPPNLKQVAQMEAYNHMTAAPMGGDEQKKALENMSALAKDDPLLAGNSERDPMKGTIDAIHASSKPQGTEYERKAREMARAMALKALQKMGAAHA
ncbi:MAG: hypothetical protein ABI682_07950 [Acidobacteriota bacterium]